MSTLMRGLIYVLYVLIYRSSVTFILRYFYVKTTLLLNAFLYRVDVDKCILTESKLIKYSKNKHQMITQPF